ncbi:hypothetical protein SLA2020_332060 [Shorea laevis]
MTLSLASLIPSFSLEAKASAFRDYSQLPALLANGHAAGAGGVAWKMQDEDDIQVIKLKQEAHTGLRSFSKSM